jgi:hypothetical protein
MDQDLLRLLAELRREELSWTEAAGPENMRCLVPRKAVDPQDLVTFLLEAAESWLQRATEAGVAVATFYSWHDEMAGQLRFSIVAGPPSALPFGASVVLASAPSDIVREVLTTWSPGVISWSELTEVAWDHPFVDDHAVRVQKVWARTSAGPSRPSSR